MVSRSPAPQRILPRVAAVGRRRVAAVVMNSVSHDARVLKQADALARGGYDVAIFGIQDDRQPAARTERESGVVVHRCSSRAEVYASAARVLVAATFVLLLVAAAAYYLAFDVFEASLSRIGRSGVLVVVGVVVIVAAGELLHRAWRHWRLSRQGSGANTALSDAGRPTWLRRAQLMITRQIKVEIVQHVRRRQLVDAVLTFAPDAVHCHDLNTVDIGLAVARRRRCAVVWDSHELYEELSIATRTHKMLARRRQRAYSGRLDAFVTINDSIARTLRERYPRLPEPVIIRNAARCPEVAPSDDGRLRRAARVEPERRILLYQGGFARFRGLDILVRAGAMLPPSWVLVMMGWGNYEAVLRAIASEYDPAGERIRFIPPASQSDLVRWTAGAQLGVIPYENVCLNHWYCTPNKLWEYPAAGVPMLVSPFPELSCVVQEHGIGRLLGDPVKPEEIAEVVGAITDEELSVMRQRCREFIVRDNWSVYERRLLGLYGRLLDRA